MAQETDVQRCDLTKPIRQVRGGTEMTIKFPNSCRGIASISSAPRAKLPPQVCSATTISTPLFDPELDCLRC